MTPISAFGFQHVNAKSCPPDIVYLAKTTKTNDGANDQAHSALDDRLLSVNTSQINPLAHHPTPDLNVLHNPLVL